MNCATIKVALVLGCSLLLAWPAAAQRQMEKLGRGVVAVRTGTNSAYVGWRLLGTDPVDTKFNLYRVTGGVTNVVAANITNSCNLTDIGAAQTLAHAWLVQPVLNGLTQALSAAFSMPTNAPIQPYLNLPLNPPPDGVAYDGVPYTYNANDCSAGDADGDGEYEIFLKWDPSNSQDNSLGGFTGNTFLDCYKLNGTRLWRIDLGPNIRSGAHYTQFMVYDFDGDGKAELMCKTAPGSLDALGNYVGGVLKWQNANGTRPSFNNTNDYRFSHPGGVTNGYVLAGPEFLTVFNGETGEELATSTYFPKRDPDNNNDNPTTSRINSVWGDNYGNRIDRFLAGVAYCDGVRPSAIFCRGYYTRAYLAAWDWRGGALSLRWTFASDPSNTAYRGQGAHSLTIGDVDADGKDEITYGAAAIDDNGAGLYSTGLGHGDALHQSDMDPLHPGLEVWMVHEEPGSYGPNGSEFRDAKTGGLIFGVDGQDEDIGRGAAYDIDPRYRGYEMWGSRGGLWSATGVQISSSVPSPKNFCVWWDADYLREHLDDTTISKWNWAGGSSSTVLSPGGIDSNNGTKATPGLSADIFGDWREEIVWRTVNNSNLCVYTTTTLATNRFHTLMHDPQYRCAIAWQNTAYNQPPHPGFFIGAGMYPLPVPPVSAADLVWRGNGANLWDTGATANWLTNGVWTGSNPAVTFTTGKSVLFDLSGSNATSVGLTGALQPEEVTVHSTKDYIFGGSGSLTGAMKLVKAGPARLTLTTTNTYTGGTFVSGGSLFVNGVLSGSAVTVERRGTPEGASQFGGSGRLGNGLTVQAGCTLVVGPGTNVPGTLTITNTFAELGGVLNQFDLSDDPTGLVKSNDLIQVVGNVNLSGTNVMDLNLLNGSLSNGVYTLIQYSGTLTGGPANFTVRGAGGKSAVLTNLAGAIGLLVSSDRLPTNVVWKGGLSANTWNQSGVSNWLNGAALDIFAVNDIVTFDDTGSTNPAVNLSGELYPASVTVNAAVNYTFAGSGKLAGLTGLTKLGSGTLTVLTTNSYTGATSIGGGTLALNQVADGGVASPLGAATSDPDNVVLSNGATLRYLGINAGLNRGATLSVGGGTIEVTNESTTLVLSGTLTGEGGLAKTGPGVLALSGTNDFSGGTLINAGTVQMGAGATSGTLGDGLVVNHGVLAFNRSDAAVLKPVITGSGAVVKNGSGTLTLTNANSYAGGTTNQAGTLVLAHNAALGNGALTFVAGSVRVGNGVVITNGWNIPGSTVDVMLDCTSGVGTWAGPVTASAGGSFRPGTSSDSGTLVYQGNASIGGANFIVPRGNVTIAGNGVISAGGTVCALGRSSSGTGTRFVVRDNASLTFGAGLMLGHTSSGTVYPIVCTVQDNATLTTATANFNLHNGPAAGSTNTVLNLNGGTLLTAGLIKSQTGAGRNATINFNGGTLKATTGNPSFLPVLTGVTANVSTNGAVIDDGGNSITIAAPLIHDAWLGAAPDGGLTKRGAGFLFLGGTNTYTGRTTVLQGRLDLMPGGVIPGSIHVGPNGTFSSANANGAGTFALGSGRTLSGNGSLIGNFTIGSGASLAPGSNSLGTLRWNSPASLTLAVGSTNYFDLAHSPLSNDTVIVSGALTNGGVLVVSNVGVSSLAAGDSFKLFDATSYSGSFAGVVLPALDPGLAWTNQLATAGTIAVISLPPASPPVFSSVVADGGNLILSGSNGPANATYYVLTATNLVLPWPNWNPFATNQFDSAGYFNLTNPIDPAMPQQFFRLSVP
jgi:autotransporter-associated beta strand protein